MKQIIGAAAIALLSATAPVLAGNAKMTDAAGTQISIACKGSGCKVDMKKPGGKWSTAERTPGGSKNFKKLQAKYKGMGFN